MLVYIIAYSLIGVSAAVFSQIGMGKARAKFSFCLFSFLVLSIVLGLRHPSMGNDLKYYQGGGYLEAFEKISAKSWEEVFALESYLNYEKGYILFNKLVGSIWADQQFFLFVCAAVSILPVIYVAYKKSEDSFFSVVIFIGLPSFLMLYSGLRQAIAIGLCFLSILFIQEKKPIKFILTVLLAYTFHDSSFIFLLAYPLYHIRLNDLMRKISVGIIPIVYLFRVPLFTVFSKFFKDEATITDGETAVTLFLVFTLVYIFCIIFQNKESKDQNGLLNLFLVACCCQAFGSVYELAMRVTYYFMMSLILLLPSVMKEAKLEKRENYLVTFGIMGAFILFGLFSIYDSSWAMAYPYYWFWE